MAQQAAPVEGTTGGNTPLNERVSARRVAPAWLRRFMKNGAGVTGLIGVIIVLVMAFAAPLLAPH
ncbi:MAG: hypothetical protein WDA15_09880, partial [Trueperaceae bacterium]